MVSFSPDQLAIAYVHFYVDDLHHWQGWFQHMLGLMPQSIPDDFLPLPPNSLFLKNPLNSDNFQIIVSAPQTQENPFDSVAQYLSKRPCGIVDVAFFLPAESPIFRGYPQGKSRRLKNPIGFQHTLIPQKNVPQTNTKIDHLVLNVPPDTLQKTAHWYIDKLQFQPQQSFQIKTDYSGLSSQVLKHPSGIQFPINQPSDRRSQIQEFLDYNGGAGIQHIALKQDNLPAQIQRLKAQKLEFLDVPQTYYENLLSRHPYLQQLPQWAQIQVNQILVDVVRSPLEMLLQIFTQPMFAEPTFFWEFIERKHQAAGFGEGNFQALFEAIEAAQKQRMLPR